MGDWTKGPWLVEPTRAVAGGVMMYWINSNTSVGTTNEADARLAGAAPDLVEALKAAPLPSTMGSAEEHYRRFYDWLNGPARAALAKAGAA